MSTPAPGADLRLFGGAVGRRAACVLHDERRVRPLPALRLHRGGGPLVDVGIGGQLGDVVPAYVSPDGSRVLLVTSVPLVPGDGDTAGDIYRVGDGQVTLLARAGRRNRELVGWSTNAGRVFCETDDQALPGDTDARDPDVYESSRWWRPRWSPAAPRRRRSSKGSRPTAGTCSSTPAADAGRHERPGGRVRRVHDRPVVDGAPRDHGNGQPAANPLLLDRHLAGRAQLPTPTSGTATAERSAARAATYAVQAGDVDTR